MNAFCAPCKERGRISKADRNVAGTPMCARCFEGGNQCAREGCSGTAGTGREFCSRACACKAMARARRKVDPKEVKMLRDKYRLSRAEIAKMLGVTKYAINNVVQRCRLGSLQNPSVCIVRGCESPVYRRRHCRGYMTGTLCLYHHSKRQAAYVRAYRRRTGVFKGCTSEQRRELARRAGRARWAGTTSEERKEFICKIVQIGKERRA